MKTVNILFLDMVIIGLDISVLILQNITIVKIYFFYLITLV